MQEAKRTEDNKIYDKALFVKKPKEIFKQIGKLCKKKGPYKKILDIGCANGAFLKFLSYIYPNATLAGWDVSKKLLARAKKNIINGTFSRVDIGKKIKIKDKFDLIISTGVSGCLDNIDTYLNNIVLSLNDGGSGFISGNFNQYPCRVFISYNDITRHPKNHKEKGWNIFCLSDVKKILKKFKNIKLKIHNFELPFDLKKNKKDFSRTWTIKINNKRVFTNGLCVMYPHKIIELQKSSNIKK